MLYKSPNNIGTYLYKYLFTLVSPLTKGP